MEITEVKLLMDHIDGKPIYEAVPAVRTGDNQYRLTGSPGFAPGVACGDEIELSLSERIGYRILKRSGNVCVQLFFNRCSFEDRQAAATIVEAIGGRLDGGKDSDAGHLLIFTIPISVGFRAIEQAMADVSARLPVDRWMYGNVYDTKDGVTPLNWWL